jgi:hypothetical protein
LSSVFNRVLGTEPGWKVILLSSPERGTEYYRGPRPTVPVDKAVPYWEERAWSEVETSLPVFRPQGDPWTLQGITEFYGRAEIFSLLKASGLTLVILVVLTSLVVFLSTRTRQRAEEPQDEPWVPEPQHEVEAVPPIGAEPQEEYWFDDSLSMDDLPPLDESLEDDLTFEDATASEAPSLFSPASGLGWNSFLSPRLDQELQRCAEQNQDLALILLAIKDGTVAPEDWGRALREAFPSIDLNFEQEEGAAIVLPGRTLEQALKAARAFVESADRSFGGAVIHAGVAARSGRLLSAATLLAEATSARKRSLSGTVRVLGLKTDPDRYREHLAASSASA